MFHDDVGYGSIVIKAFVRSLMRATCAQTPAKPEAKPKAISPSEPLASEFRTIPNPISTLKEEGKVT